MARYFLEVAYHGAAYSGFQVQENAQTIQGVVEKALATFYREPIILTGSSRTDAGVHAKQNFFHTDTTLEPEAQHLYNLNALLPGDIVLKGIYRVPPEAHCRFDACSREYKYVIYNQKNPFLADRAWYYPYPLEMGILQEMAALVPLFTDFSSFSKRNTQVKTYECRVMISEWVREGGQWIYRVQANRFLRGMVRGLVGTMVRASRKPSAVAVFREICAGRDMRRVDFSAPARGLFLEAVRYPDVLEQYWVGEKKISK
ncbi:MAG TPA: tRNA pseudouridine(38-40) synthase TruA [Sediminibacterium sp.]|nr:tRNA pseudouridine(38-40) synthase TruA [Sediminibacterium sp.]